MKYVLALLICLVSVVSSAQDYLCCIEVEDGIRDPTVCGSLIHVTKDKGYILTCDHVFHKLTRDGRPILDSNGTVARIEGTDIRVSFFKDGKPIVSHTVEGARLYAYSKDMDVALIEIDHPPHVTPAKLALFHENKDSLFIVQPYPSTKRKRLRGLFSRWNHSVIHRPRAQLNFRIASGYSGSPLLNQKKEVVGIATGNYKPTWESLYEVGQPLLDFVYENLPKEE